MGNIDNSKYMYNIIILLETKNKIQTKTSISLNNKRFRFFSLIKIIAKIKSLIIIKRIKEKESKTKKLPPQEKLLKPKKENNNKKRKKILGLKTLKTDKTKNIAKALNNLIITSYKFLLN